MKDAVVVFAVVLAATGCGHNYRVALSQDGFVNEVIGYRIAPSKTFHATRGDGEWMVDNFGPNGDLKEGAEYVTEAGLDTNGDGQHETKRTLPLYDLRLRSRRTGARISARMLPLDIGMGDRELAGLVRDYVDAVAGAGSVAVQPLGQQARIERRYATRTIDHAPLKVGGLPAHGATFSVFNVDQQQVESGRPEETVRIVLAKTGRRWPVTAALDVERSPQDDGGYPAFILFQATSRPEDFEDTASAFREVVWGFRLLPREGYPAVPARPARSWPVEWTRSAGNAESAAPPAPVATPEPPATADPAGP